MNTNFWSEMILTVNLKESGGTQNLFKYSVECLLYYIIKNGEKMLYMKRRQCLQKR